MKKWICLICGNEWENEKPRDCPHCASFEIQMTSPFHSRKPYEVFTLRDFFAGCALMGLLANPCEIDDATIAIPHDAYLYADAMLAARVER
jgi:hypothetical protein